MILEHGKYQWVYSDLGDTGPEKPQRQYAYNQDANDSSNSNSSNVKQNSAPPKKASQSSLGRGVRFQEPTESQQQQVS